MGLPVAPIVASPSVVRILGFEIAPGDVVFVRLARDAAEIEAVFYALLTGRVATFSRFDIQGGGPNILGCATLRELVQLMME
jgi:hypothetical protein